MTRNAQSEISEDGQEAPNQYMQLLQQSNPASLITFLPAEPSFL